MERAPRPLTILLLPVYYFRATRSRPGRLRAAFNRWDLRLPWAAVGAALHLGILVLIDVGPFSLISLSYHVNLFTPEELERCAHRWLYGRSAALVHRKGSPARRLKI